MNNNEINKMIRNKLTIFILLMIVFRSFSQIDTSKNQINTFTDYIGFYQRFISPIKGSTCPMYPSCSNYGLQAFRTKKPFIAFAFSADRLLRCGHEHKFYDLTLQKNGFKLIDVVDSALLDKNIIYSKEKIYYAFSDTVYPKSGSLEFIKYLINNHYYSCALLEISRLIYSKQNVNEVELYTNYIICLRALNMNEKALFEYDVYFPNEIKNNSTILTEIGNVWLELENYTKANEYFEKAKANSKDLTLIEHTNMLCAYTFAKQFNWDKSNFYFNKIPTSSNYYHIAQKNLQILEEVKNQKIKNPFIAGVLGIIPGAGYLYASHKQTAIASFVVNSLLMYATYSNIEKKNYGMVTLVGVFSLSFYIGNISGSVRSAKRYNQSIRMHYLNKIQKD